MMPRSRMRSPQLTPARATALVFVTALAVRAVMAWLFLGSVDVLNNVGNAARLFLGEHPSALPIPYFPGIHLFLAAGSRLAMAMATAMPVGFLYKIWPCIFDSMTAAVVYDYYAERGLRFGLLYAFAPVAILNTSIHGQWDAISIGFCAVAFLLLRKDGDAAAIAAGAAFVISVIAKPVTAPLVLFLFPAPRKHALITGLVGATALYCAILFAIGDPPSLRTLRHVVGYAAEGIQNFGLPMLLGLDPNRLLSLAALLILVPLYWFGRIEREHAALLLFLSIIGTAALCAQYLFWPLPFLLIAGHVRFAALYNAAAATYTVILFSWAGASLQNSFTLGAFIPLRGLAWLTPVIDTTNDSLRWLILLGSFAIPVMALAFVLVLLFRARTRPLPRLASLAGDGRRIMLVVLAALVIVTIGVVAASRMPRPTGEETMRTLGAKIVTQYEVTRFPTHEGPWWRTDTGRGIDVRHIAGAWIAIWCAAAWLMAPRRVRA